jgi:hypothetical protein
MAVVASVTESPWEASRLGQFSWALFDWANQPFFTRRRPVGSLSLLAIGFVFASCAARSPAEVNFLVPRLNDSTCPSCFWPSLGRLLRFFGGLPRPKLSTSVCLPTTARSEGPIGDDWSAWLLSEASALSTRRCFPSRTRVTEPVAP